MDLELLEGLNREGLTLLVVTHDPSVARRADRILLLVDGKTVERLPGKEVDRAVALLAADDDDEEP